MNARRRTDHTQAQGSLPRHGVARALSKMGQCSRTQAAALVRAGQVRVNGQRVLDPEAPVVLGRDRIEIDGSAVAAAERVYIALNKPRGLVTTVADERGRDTVYSCLTDANLPWLAPVGRLDRASEGLLLLTNDSAWAARLTAPESHVEKTYHVQIDRVPDEALVAAMHEGRSTDQEHLHAKRAAVLRRGDKNGWIEVVLDEGRNRQIRRLLEALDVRVLRLLRVAIGSLVLGDLAKGAWRRLGGNEVERLGRE